MQIDEGQIGDYGERLANMIENVFDAIPDDEVDQFLHLDVTGLVALSAAIASGSFSYN